MRRALVVLAACGGGSHTPPQKATPVAQAWPVPTGWKAEVIAFPLDFAPDLAHRGVEVIRFAPGFFDPAAPGYWSYTFAWRLDDDGELEPRQLSGELATYFQGLVASVDDKHKISDDDRNKIAVTAEPFASHDGDSAGRFTITVDMIDAFKTFQPVALVGTAERRACGGGALWTFTLMPKAGTLGQQLADLARQATCDNVHR